MSSGDLLSVAAGVVIVILVASVVQWWGDDGPPIDDIDGGQHPALPPGPPDPTQSPTPVPAPPTTTLGYVEKPVLKYKTYLMPKNISLFGASDPPWKTRECAVFASLEEERGGVTGTFTVPYPMWRMNCTVVSDNDPGSTLFRAVLVDATTNTIIEGMELMGPGHVVKNIEVSGGEYYLIVGCQHAHFTMNMETKQEFLGL